MIEMLSNVKGANLKSTGISQEQVHLGKSKAPRKSPEEWAFLSLDSYNAPSFHTVDFMLNGKMCGHPLNPHALRNHTPPSLGGEDSPPKFRERAPENTLNQIWG